MVASLVRVHQTCNLLKNLFDSFENFLLRLVDFQFDRIEYYKHSSLKTTERKDLNLKKKRNTQGACLSSCILKFLYGLNEKRIHCLTFFAQEFLQTISSISLLFPHPSSSQYPRIFDKLISIIVFFFLFPCI